MRKPIKRIITVCPYVTEEESIKFWNQAKVIARQRRLQGKVYWSVVAKIAGAMAAKLDEKRRIADEADWKEKSRRQQDMWTDS